MKKRKRIVLFVAVLLAVTVWELSETSVAEATTGQVSVTGRIGETVTQEEETDDDNKKTIVADASQIGQGKLPQTGSSNTTRLIILGFVLLVLTLLAQIRNRKRILKNMSIG
ncbi:LPXTG cell wall anchor domain-containing protein [Enterococcus innesii]|uniref:LPXTG cell wall anchor domain-containing protein n=1 Tax=Enterococcus innesii TaxID=2839759 RepID=UPI0022B9C4A7|nr:LPXTG cell wall anchor domain-containing protein [Enterococcus innesii]